MRWTPLGLLVAALLAVPGRATNLAALDPAAAAEAETSKPSPELVRLDQELAKIQDAREHGRVKTERYAELLSRFRAELDEAMAAAVPSPENIALHSRILARLGDRKQASIALVKALQKNPENTRLRLALSQVRFDEMNYPAALIEANAVLARDPDNQEALTLMRFSEGRVAMNGRTADDYSPPLAPRPARRSSSRRFHFVVADPATLPLKLPVKFSPAGAPPEVIASGDAPVTPSPLPLVPLAEAAALGLAAFEVSRSRGAYVSDGGLDDEHPKPVGRYQKLVAGTILAGALGAVLYLSGAALLNAAPVALGYVANIGSSALRVAGSEAGAFNPNATKVVNEVPKLFARVIPYDEVIEVQTIGRAGEPRAFVTAAEDIAGLNPLQLSQRLGIKLAQRFLVIRFPASESEFSTPVAFKDPQFIGRGLTSGGAREFLIPNGPIPTSATFEVVK